MLWRDPTPALEACFKVAVELRAAALDPAAALDMTERRSLAAMASAVEGAALHRTDTVFDRTAVEAETAAAPATLERRLRSGSSPSAADPDVGDS